MGDFCVFVLESNGSFYDLNDDIPTLEEAQALGRQWEAFTYPDGSKKFKVYVTKVFRQPQPSVAK